MEIGVEVVRAVVRRALVDVGASNTPLNGEGQQVRLK